MSINNSQIANNGGKISGSQVVGSNESGNIENNNKAVVSKKFYVFVGISSFIGGVLASIVANIITSFI